MPRSLYIHTNKNKDKNKNNKSLHQICDMHVLVANERDEFDEIYGCTFSETGANRRDGQRNVPNDRRNAAEISHSSKQTKPTTPINHTQVDAKIEKKYEEILDHLTTALNSTEEDEEDFKKATEVGVCKVIK